MTDRRPFNTPRKVSLAITGKCNLRCGYCFYANEMVALGDLPTEQWQLFFSELGELGVMEATLCGGEPFTRSDIFELIDGLISNRMRYSLLTNATLIDDEVIRELHVGKRRLRLDSIQVSIDGSCAEVHDRSRPASFDRALTGLRLLTEAGLPVTVRVTINRYNLDDLENIAELLLVELGIPAIGTNEAMPLGAGCQNRGELSLNAAEKARAMQTLDRLLQRFPGRIQAAAGPQKNQQMYAQMEHAKATGEKAQNWEMGRLTSCGCVFANIDVLHDGGIVPCHMLPTLVLGRINRDPLEKIWRSDSTLEALRQRRTITMAEVPGCGGCEWTDYCNGGCPGLAYQLTGDFNRANPESCYRAFLAASGGPDGV